MRRRDFVTFLSGATAWAATARAQESRRVIGVLGSASYGAFPGSQAAFIQGLRDTGFIEGNNIGIEWRWAERQYDRSPSLAGELLGRNVSVIVAFDAPAAFAAKAATKTTPMAFLTGTDPVAIGLVRSFSRPGGNLTGVGQQGRARRLKRPANDPQEIWEGRNDIRQQMDDSGHRIQHHRDCN